MLGLVLTFTAVILYLLSEAFWSSEKKNLCILVLCGAHSAEYAQNKPDLLKLGKAVLVPAVISMNQWSDESLATLVPWSLVGLRGPPDTPSTTRPPTSKAALSAGEVESTSPVEHGPLHRSALDMSIHKTNDRYKESAPGDTSTLNSFIFFTIN